MQKYVEGEFTVVFWKPGFLFWTITEVHHKRFASRKEENVWHNRGFVDFF
jgi:hypothetical protein